MTVPRQQSVTAGQHHAPDVASVILNRGLVHRILRRMRSTISYSPSTMRFTSPQSTTPSPPRARSRRTTTAFPSLAFAVDMPLKATPSPPSTSISSSHSSSASSLSLTPSSSLSSSTSILSDSSFSSLSHPDWPKSDTLSAPTSPSQSAATATATTVSGSQASCYITDEDLEDLAQLPLWNSIRVPEHFAAHAYGQAVAPAVERERELPPLQIAQRRPVATAAAVTVKPAGRRKRSREVKRKGVVSMTPIAEE